jgi:trehalose synthase
VDPAGLVHALQNHDELTYELVHWATGHRDEVHEFRGARVTGAELAERVRRDLCEHLTGPDAPYNLIFTTNGIACTTATVIAAALGVRDLDDIDAGGPDAVTTAGIARVHLLLAMFNALQPGVFALSGWDLTGMLTLPPAQVADLLEHGDTRWIHRAAHDLMGVAPTAAASASGMPRGRSLYGTIPDQLADETSFLRQLQAILAVRTRYGIAVAEQIDVPAVAHHGMLVLVHRLAPAPDGGGDGDGGATRLHLSVLNFAAEHVTATVRSEHLVPGAVVTDMFNDQLVGVVDDLQGFAVELEPHQGHALLVTLPAAAPRVGPPDRGHE